MNDIEILESYLSEKRLNRIRQVLSQRTRELCIVIDTIDKEHNYMALLRTCEAYGIQDVHIIIGKDQKDEKITKHITQGAHKWLTIHKYSDWQDCFNKLHEQGYKIYASYLSEDAGSLQDMDIANKTALLFGNELLGLRESRVKACDGSFILPMYGFSQSFNISVACALSIQLFTLARESKGIERGKLSENEHATLYKKWIYKAVPNAEQIVREHKKRGDLE